MDTQRQAFEEALQKDRYDSVTRLVYADWLEENGLDDEAREQRRMASPEWIASDQWMHKFASTLGTHSPYYSESWRRDRENRERQDIGLPPLPEIHEEVIPMSYEIVMEAAKHWLETYKDTEWGPDGDYFTQNGDETARDEMGNPNTRAEFWKHYQQITGASVEKEKQGQVFSCSC